MIYLLIYVASPEGPLSFLEGIFQVPALAPGCLGRVLELAMVLITVVSGLDVLQKNRRLLADG